MIYYKMIEDSNNLNTKFLSHTTRETYPKTSQTVFRLPKNVCIHQKSEVKNVYKSNTF